MTTIPPTPRTCPHNALRYLRCPRCGRWVCPPCLELHETAAQHEQPCPHDDDGEDDDNQQPKPPQDRNTPG